MSKFDTIIAPVTNISNSPVAVIRVSGPKSYDLAFSLCGKKLIPRQVSFCIFRNEKLEILDKGIAVFFSSPNSFTGEDVVEFQCHGSSIIVELLIENCLKFSKNNEIIRLAEPGEFSKRAFLNDKIDLMEAEAIANLINASSEAAVHAVHNSTTNNFRNLLDQVSEILLSLRVDIESKLDFLEENFTERDLDRTINTLFEVKKHIRKCLEHSQNGKKISELGKLTLFGRTNVGKSSLLNWLSGSEAAIVSQQSGTTRDVIKENVRISNLLRVEMSDTAGIRKVEDEVEVEGIKRSWKEIDSANCILFICDSSSNDLEEDLKLRDEILKKLDGKDKTLLTVFNKIDKVDLQEFSSKIKKLNFDTHLISIKKNLGLEIVRKEIEKIFNLEAITDLNHSLLVSNRNYKNLRKTLTHIVDAEVKISQNQFDISAEELRLAHETIKQMRGDSYSEDILDGIFSTFCIGK